MLDKGDPTWENLEKSLINLSHRGIAELISGKSLPASQFAPSTEQTTTPTSKSTSLHDICVFNFFPTQVCNSLQSHWNHLLHHHNHMQPLQLSCSLLNSHQVTTEFSTCHMARTNNGIPPKHPWNGHMALCLEYRLCRHKR